MILHSIRRIRTLLASAQRRFRRARPGSVLIMVVALLVLLALIGAAAMSTARVDRQASVTNVRNTQIDLILQGVRDMLIGAFTDDAKARGPNLADSPATVAEQNYSLEARRDVTLASRLPERLHRWNTAPNRNQDPIVWRFISYPPFAGSPNQLFMSNPPNKDTISNPVNFELSLPKVWAWRPTWIALQNGDIMPGLEPINPDGSSASGGEAFLAADADGDGIADSLLYKLPGSTIDSLTYYMALRVIDHNSAINVNTAWRYKDTSNTDANDKPLEVALVRPMNGERVVNNTFPLALNGIFPASVDLQGILSGNSTTRRREEMWSLNHRRFLDADTAASGQYDEMRFGFQPLWDDPFSTAMPPPGGARGDFVFLTPGDLVWHQLGRRLDYPGFYQDTSGAARMGSRGGRPFGISEQANLGYRFVLRPEGAASRIGNALYESVDGNFVRSEPYKFNANQNIAANETAIIQNLWFAGHFDFWPGSPTYQPPVSARPLLTTYNPTSNQVFRHVPNFAGFGSLWVSSGNNQGNGVVPWPNLHRKDQGIPDNPQNALYTLWPNFTPFESKTNPNTATFEELWASFYDVMCDDQYPAMPEFEDIDGRSQFSNPYFGQQFNYTSDKQPQDSVAADHPSRMFRSSLRPPVADFDQVKHRLTPFHMMMIRSAIAAANVIDARDLDNDVTTFRLRFPKWAVEQPGKSAADRGYEVVIFGTEHNPYFSEVYLSNNTFEADVKQAPPLTGFDKKKNPQGFAAIELHNPYDEPISLLNWRIRLIDRHATGGNYGLRFETSSTNRINQNSGTGEYVFGNITIPPRGYLVLWNYLANASDLDSAQYLSGGITLPNAPNVAVEYIKELHKIQDREFVLMRPLLANSGNNSEAIVPVDSFDATGFTHRTDPDTSPLAPNVFAWHYVRANDPNLGRSWQFVYPGRYDASRAAGEQTPRQQGTQYVTWDATAIDPGTGLIKQEPWMEAATLPKPEIEIGEPDKQNGREGNVQPQYANGTASAVPWPFAIQVAGHQMPGPMAPDDNDKPFRFPFGGFARAGDILSVPYIGAYYVFDVETWVPPTNTVDFFSGDAVFVECNSLTMDSVFAEDTDISNDYFEDIGRFAPMSRRLQGGDPVDLNALRGIGVVSEVVDDRNFNDFTRDETNGTWNNYEVYVYNPLYNPLADPSKPAEADFAWRRQVRIVNNYKWSKARGGEFRVDAPFFPRLIQGTNYRTEFKRVRYGWAADILEYFTAIHSPADDFLPNINRGEPARSNQGGPYAFPTNPQVPDYEFRTNAGNIQTVNERPVTVRNRPGVSPPHNRLGQQTEDAVPTEGLININTAHWRILAALPMVTDNNGIVDRPLNELLAQQIVYYRDVDDQMGWSGPHPHGAFKSIMELNHVPGFTDAMGTLLIPDAQTFPPASNPNEDPGVHEGDFSPFREDARDGVRADFEEKFLVLNRISNLITTRSDTYTCYLLVQGWRDADTPNAALITQRRAAFVFDRSRMLKRTDQPAIFMMPSN